METRGSQILQLNDVVSNRKCTLRMDLQDAALPLSELLDKYLKNAPIDLFLRESRITQRSADALYALQDLVYGCTDSGHLTDIYSGTVFKGDDPESNRSIELDQVPTNYTAWVAEQEVSVIDISVDRMNVDYDRNWVGFHERKWLRDPDKFSSFVRNELEGRYSPTESECILRLETPSQKLKLLEALSRRVWDSQFENYSRFTGKKLVYKSGDETIENIIDGAGAICSEKVQALKFLTDHYGLKSEYILAGENTTGPVPVEKLRELLITFDFRFAKRYMRFWQHTALLYDLDNTQVLVDATNGNIPFLFLQNGEAERILGVHDKRPVRVKMVEAEEDFYYHRVPQDIPENLFFALEGWWTYSDLMQVFDNELGLFLSSDFYVTPIPFKSEREYTRDRQDYIGVCQKAGLECAVTREWTLESSLGAELSEAEAEVSQRILQSQEHLLARLDECEGPRHESGLVIIRLRPQLSQ